MKTLFILVIFFGMIQFIDAQSIGIGTNSPNVSAALDVTSITQGMLVPRMTSAQRALISFPAQGLLVFDLTTNSFWFRKAGSWVQLIDSDSTEVYRNGTDKIYMGMTKNVGIGMSTPGNKFDIMGAGLRTGSHPTGRPLYVTGAIGASADGIEFRHFNGTQGIGLGYNTIYATGSDASQNLGLQARGPGGSLLFNVNNIESMRINPSGNVGIGTTSPAYKLSVTDKFGIDDNGAVHFINLPRQIYFYEDGLPSKMILSHSPSYPTWGLEYTAANQFRFLADSAAVMTVDLDANHVSISGDATVNGTLDIGWTGATVASISIPPLSGAGTTCNCPPGTVVISGSFNFPADLGRVLRSYSSTPTSWYAYAYNDDAIYSHTFYVGAICARLAN